jgi:AcrR family transcriptional regulator
VAARERKGPGRRPAGSGTRETILETARDCFAELGYDRTTLRGIATRAGVDVALVSHYFGGKQQLFAEAAVLPFDPSALVPRLLDGPRDGIGRRLMDFVMDILDDPEARARMTALIRAAAAEDAAAEQVRRRITSQVLMPLASGLGADRPELRAALTGSQIVGLVMARHVVGLHALAGTDRAVLTDAVAPVVQHYLTGDLTRDLDAAR